MSTGPLAQFSSSQVSAPARAWSSGSGVAAGSSRWRREDARAAAATWASVAAEQEPARTTPGPVGSCARDHVERPTLPSASDGAERAGEPGAAGEQPEAASPGGDGVQVGGVDRVDDDVADAGRSRRSLRPLDDRLRSLMDDGQSEEADSPAVCRCSTRAMLASVIGVSGWWRIDDSESRSSPTKRWPRYMVRPCSGDAGQIRVMVSPSASSRASATGPMLPSSVESKVEQYLK